MTRGAHAFQAAKILARVAENKREYGCAVPRCRGGCAGYLTTLEAHEFALCPTARFDAMRKEGWTIECQKRPSGDNLFHFLSKEAVQAELVREERLVFVGDISAGISLYEVAR